MGSDDIFITKSDYVYQHLKSKIINGELAMGENLNISKISDEFNISTIPVREAIKKLEAEGLIDFTSHKGAQVKSFNPDKIKEIYEIRAVLEGLAAKSAIPNMTPDKIEYLKFMAEQMRQYAINEDALQFGNLNKEFHRFIYENSSYQMLYDMIFQLWEGNWTKAIFALHKERMFKAVEEHLEIIQAIEEKDENKTEQLVRLHKLNTAHLYESIVNKLNTAHSYESIVNKLIVSKVDKV